MVNTIKNGDVKLDAQSEVCIAGGQRDYHHAPQMKKLYLACVAALCSSAVLVQPALGQETAPVNTAAPAVPETPAAPLASQEGIAEVKVTALRVESLASRTPVALTAVSGDSLRNSGVSNPTALGDLVPNLSITRGNGLQITIRGVTSSDGSEKGDPSAAFLLDGVYIARPQVQETSFFDIARIEVLRGPQGTLYGRNTTAGVVNVISNRPVESFEAAANVAYGAFNTKQADAMVNIPVSESFALRAAASFDGRDSYLYPSPGERFSFDPFKKNASARVQGLFTISPDINFLVKADYSSLKGNPLQSVRGIGFFNVTVPRNPVPLSESTRSLSTVGYLTQQQGAMNNTTSGLSGELNWNLGPVSMTYLGSFRDFKRDEAITTLLGGPVASQFNGTYRQNSQELRFATNDKGAFQGQAGVYYFKEKSDINFMLFNALPGVPFYGFPQDPVINETYAVFGQGTYKLNPVMRLTLGARYSHDDKSRIGGTVKQQTAVFNPATDTELLNAAQTTSSKVTYRAGLEYDLNERTLAYGTFSTGYKAGGFNDGCAAGAVINGVACNQPRPANVLYYAPETLNSYEVGLKTRLANNKVRINTSAFYYDYKNLQLSQLVVLNGGPSAQTSNAGKAKVQGVEVEAIVAPAPGHRLDASYAFLDAHYTEYFPLAASSVAADRSLSYAGRPLDRSPRNVVSAGYTYTHPLDAGNIVFGIRSRWSSSYVLTAFGTPAQYQQGAASATDVTLTYNAPGKAWYVQGYGKNLEDKVRITGTDSRANFTLSDPRTYGVRAGMRF